MDDRIIDAEAAAAAQPHHVNQPQLPPAREPASLPESELTIDAVIQRYPGSKIIKALYDFEGKQRVGLRVNLFYESVF